MSLDWVSPTWASYSPKRLADVTRAEHPGRDSPPHPHNDRPQAKSRLHKPCVVFMTGRVYKERQA